MLGARRLKIQSAVDGSLRLQDLTWTQAGVGILHQSRRYNVSSVSRQRIAMCFALLGVEDGWIVANHVIGAKSGGGCGRRMAGRRINLKPGYRRSAPRLPAGVRTLCHRPELVLMPTAYSPSSHRTAFEANKRARFTEAWCFHFCSGHGAISPAPNLTRTATRSRSRPASHPPTDESTALTVRRLYFSRRTPPPQPRRRFGDGSDGCCSLSVVYRPSHPRRDPASHQRLQHVRLTQGATKPV